MFGILVDSFQSFYNFNAMGNMLVKKATLKARMLMHNVLQKSRQKSSQGLNLDMEDGRNGKPNCKRWCGITWIGFGTKAIEIDSGRVS